MSSGVDGAEYWNHNSAYHPWILRQIDGRFGLAALDVGCGEGLLLQRLSPHCATLVGIDPDPSSIARARRRLPQATLLTQLFDNLSTDQSFDLITMVASLHHMELEPTLHKVRQLLGPGGQFLVVGLSARKSVADWVISALSVPVSLIGSTLHRETRDIGVQVAQPRESLAEIRAAAAKILPGTRIRRGVYYRYLLSYRQPA